MINDQYYWIYNRQQANWMLENGLRPVEIGEGKLNDIYLKFIRNKQTEKMVNKWKLRDIKI